MTDTPAPGEFRDFRVLYQFIDGNGPIPDGNTPPVERYEFTTVLARSAEEAETALASAGYHDQDEHFQVIQVVESNGRPTGFTVDEPAPASDTPIYDAIAEQEGI